MTKSTGSTDVRAVLVDMDDTIFDHSMTCRAAIARLRTTEPFLRRRPLQGLWNDYLTLLNSVAPEVLSGQLTVDAARRERWRRLASSCGTELAPRDAASLSREYRELYQRLRRPVPGARELLGRLHRHVRVVIVTNNQVAEQEEKVRFLRLSDRIDGLVVSEAVGAAKPDRRIFEVALATAGATPGQATMLGDSWESDIVGSRAVGIRAVWFNRFGLAPPTGPPAEQLQSLRPPAPAQTILTGRRTGRPRATSSPRGRAL